LSIETQLARPSKIVMREPLYSNEGAALPR
jgi:hypothetical protein